MKNISKSILLSAAAVAGFGLSSCVAPYDTGVATTSTTTTYSPGYTVTSLPSGYRSETIDGSNYYYHNGAYYRSQSNKYVVVDAPRRSRYYNEYSQYGTSTVRNNRDGSSSVITTLPSGYQTVDYRGTPYYRAQDTYYRRQGNGYITVANPF